MQEQRGPDLLYKKGQIFRAMLKVEQVSRHALLQGAI
jgi:hypothetical protein